MSRNIVNGFPDGTFQPDGSLTRAQFVKMLVLTLGLAPGNGQTSFTDVAASDWFAPYVSAGVSAGLAQGLSATTFGPNEVVTREQMATFLARALKLTGTESLPFSDTVQIDSWALPSVRAAVAAGLIAGFPDDTFRPLDPTTRAQAAKVLALAMRAPANPSVTLSPAAEWSAAVASPACRGQGIDDVFACVDGGPVSPQSGGAIDVHLVDTSGATSASSQLSGTLDLQLTPYGTYGAPPLTQVQLPRPPTTLGSGQVATLQVKVPPGLAPGYYTAAVTGTLQVDGASIDVHAFTPPIGTAFSFLVTGSSRPAGTVPVNGVAVPTIGGLAMPLLSISWDTTDRASFDVHVPTICGPGTDRAAQLTTAALRAAGPGFDSWVGGAGGGTNPAIAESTWGFQPFPGESTSLELTVSVQVRACNGTQLGATLGSGTAMWQVQLPPAPASTG